VTSLLVPAGACLQPGSPVCGLRCGAGVVQAHRTRSRATRCRTSFPFKWINKKWQRGLLRHLHGHGWLALGSRACRVTQGSRIR